LTGFAAGGQPPVNAAIPELAACGTLIGDRQEHAQIIDITDG
jgi:hypothetical protein